MDTFRVATWAESEYASSAAAFAAVRTASPNVLPPACRKVDKFRVASIPTLLPASLHCKHELRACRKVDTFRVATWAESEYASSAAAFASILDVVRDHEVTLPGHICAVLVTVLVLEGWSSQLAPERSLLEEVKAVFATDTRSWRERMSLVVDRWLDWAPVLPSLDSA